MANHCEAVNITLPVNKSGVQIDNKDGVVQTFPIADAQEFTMPLDDHACWWDVARYTAPFSIAELDVCPALLHRIQREVCGLVTSESTEVRGWHRLPCGSCAHLAVDRSIPSFELGLVGPRAELNSDRASSGLRLVLHEHLSPIDSTWLDGLDWPIDEGVVIPWLTSSSGEWRDPDDRDLETLLRAMRWVRYHRRVDHLHTRRVAS